MPSLLDKLRATLRRATNTTADLAAAVDQARAGEADAIANVERQAKAVADGFMDDDAKRATARAKLADLRGLAEDAAAIRAELERRHDAAVAGEEQGRRRAVYDGAKAQADAAAIALSRTYPKLAAGMVEMLRELATAQMAVTVANAALPDGVEPIVDPEMAVRGVSGSPREIISEEDVDLWSRLDMQTPVDAAFQDGIYSLDKADGTPSGWGKRPEDQEAVFRLRRFRKVTYRESVNGDYPLPLAAALQIPAVRGSGMLWGENFPVHVPGLSMTVTGQAEPGAVLTRLAEADATATAKPSKAERPVKVEWTWLGETVATPDKPVAVDTGRSRPPSTGLRFGASPFSLPTPGARGRSTGARR